MIIRNTANYDDHAHFARIEAIVRTLNAAGSLDRQIADALTAEGIMNNEGRPFTATTVSQLRSRWSLPTVKINGCNPCPDRWPDGSYSAQGAAKTIGVTVLTVRHWLQRGIIKGSRLGPRLPWQLDLTNDDIVTLQARKRPIGNPKRKAS